LLRLLREDSGEFLSHVICEDTGEDGVTPVNQVGNLVDLLLEVVQGLIEQHSLS
jgi:hypothetical protein